MGQVLDSYVRRRSPFQETRGAVPDGPRSVAGPAAGQLFLNRVSGIIEDGFESVDGDLGGIEANINHLGLRRSGNGLDARDFTDRLLNGADAMAATDVGYREGDLL